MTEGNPVAGPQCKLMIEELRKAGWTIIGPGEHPTAAHVLEAISNENEQLRRERNSEESGKLYLREELRRRRQELARLRADLDRANEIIQAFVDAEVDYMMINHLGDPEKQHNVKWASAFFKHRRAQ